MFITPQCIFEVNHITYPCAWGKAGVSQTKQEGDNTTPIGKFKLREIYYRADRIPAYLIKTSLPINIITRDDAWCDDVDSKSYNQHIKLPFKGSYENLWRNDALYDVVIVIGYNDKPIKTGKGSAIFLHIAQNQYQPTHGCITLAKNDLLAILPYLTPDQKIEVTKDGVKILK